MFELFFEGLTRSFETPLDWNRKTAWKSFYELLPLHGILADHYAVCNAKFAWQRSNPKIHSIFSKLWNCKADDLLTSLDECSLSIPPENKLRGWHNKNWIHYDQPLSNNSLDCYLDYHIGCWVLVTRHSLCRRGLISTVGTCMTGSNMSVRTTRRIGR